MLIRNIKDGRLVLTKLQGRKKTSQEMYQDIHIIGAESE